MRSFFPTNRSLRVFEGIKTPAGHLCPGGNPDLGSPREADSYTKILSTQYVYDSAGGVVDNYEET